MILRRVQQLRISLAAKCQLLFGAAVVLIIAAALFVPWHRIEQLTEQLNERTASALTDRAIAEHLAGSFPALNAPSSPASLPSSRPTPAGNFRLAVETAPQPRLAPIGSRRETSDLARFEGRAAGHFINQRDLPFYAAYYERRDGSSGYRYARPLYFNESCAACHIAVNRSARPAVTNAIPSAGMSAVSLNSTDASTPASGPASRPIATSRSSSPALESSTDGRLVLYVDRGADDSADLQDQPPLTGVASVDFTSRVDANQLLLNRVFILTAGTIAGVLAIVTFYFITTRLILQPVRVLQETAEKVSKGDLNIRSDISTGDEFQQLSETFNVMLTNLKASADELQAKNKTLDLKVGEFAQSNVALYESNRLKSEFLANVSHELRTPLNSILGFADLLRETISSPAESKTTRYIGNIRTSGRHLLELINDLLDLAKIEAGRMEVRSEPLSVPDMFEGLANLLKPLLEQKRLTLDISVAPAVPILQTDPGKLQQVLYNFLSNAIKFSPTGQLIELKAILMEDDDPSNSSIADANNLPPLTPRLPRPPQARNTGEYEPHVRISVTDRGPGIAAEQQNVIFEKFRQIDGSVTRAHGGSGLGLAISKELVLLMGGSIGIKSKVGEGATFWVLLPLTITAGSRDIRSKLTLT